jgi:hypothetical protein
MASVVIDVTAADIKAGHPLACSFCPVAIAATRAFGGRQVIVDSFLSIRGQERLAWSLPQSVYDFVKAFDAGRPVAPFSFILEGVRDDFS